MEHEHLIRLRGAQVQRGDLSAHLLNDLFGVLVIGAEQSLRLHIDGSSTPVGARPAWLREASDFKVSWVEAGGDGVFRLAGRSIVESMPEKFRQRQLFDDLDARKSPLDLFEDALEAALAGDADSDAFDGPMLKTFSKFGSVLRSGVDSIEIENGRTVRVESGGLARVEQLASARFDARAVRIAGRMEAIGYSDCRFVLILENGAKVAGTARELGAEVLRGHFGQAVVVTGLAEFRPSGKLLRVEASSVEVAGENDLQVFGTLPRPRAAEAGAPRAASKRGLSALLGQWPAEDSAEDLLEQLRQLS